MDKTRLMTFTDGVIAIIITIMVLNLHAPVGTNWASLWPVMPTFLTYAMSFVYLAIYWNNHHHMLHATDHVDGKILWANMHLLFWLTLVPFTTAWMAQNGFAQIPTALYGINLLLAAIAYFILFHTIIAHEDANEELAEAIGNDAKGKISLVLYIAGLALAFLNQWIAIGIYTFVALMWLVPDRRIERKLGHRA